MVLVLAAGGWLVGSRIEQRRANGAVMDVGSTELVAQRGEPMDVSVEITNSSARDVVFNGDPTLIAIPGIRNGRSLGTFAAGGVQVHYRLGSTEGSSRVFGGWVDCVQLKPVQCSGPGTETSDEILTKLDALR